MEMILLKKTVKNQFKLNKINSSEKNLWINKNNQEFVIIGKMKIQKIFKKPFNYNNKSS